MLRRDLPVAVRALGHPCQEAARLDVPARAQARHTLLPTAGLQAKAHTAPPRDELLPLLWELEFEQWSSERRKEGDPPLQEGNPPQQVGDPPLHAGDPPLHAGNPPLQEENPPLHAGDPPASPSRPDRKGIRPNKLEARERPGAQGRVPDPQKQRR